MAPLIYEIINTDAVLIMFPSHYYVLIMCFIIFYKIIIIFACKILICKAVSCINSNRIKYSLKWKCRVLTSTSVKFLVTINH